MTQFNIYFGSIANTKYQYTKSFKNEIDANKNAEQSMFNFYFKKEGTKGFPSYNTIYKEAQKLNVEVGNLYSQYVNSMCRYYVIPTELDTISKKDLMFD